MTTHDPGNPFHVLVNSLTSGEVEYLSADAALLLTDDAHGNKYQHFILNRDQHLLIRLHADQRYAPGDSRAAQVQLDLDVRCRAARFSSWRLNTVQPDALTDMDPAPQTTVNLDIESLIVKTQARRHLSALLGEQVGMLLAGRAHCAARPDPAPTSGAARMTA
ncbi:hypothetical protein [Deinococcus soli (ex Cha et al. 2016)]|uniref:Uncharacterized protein n=2 Tax=Deinococcus soli (ex Cha et al. 2016) TaxID=1309411 RepID=A0ACC6KGQ7_9DEIO|nr:hypothetical protein [Deinococcus soli (ex Cha et al. 2016)]MDR6218181.1 hypothetical protein [Deinococcus soli (ex Cha et al. 2016)]MDR6328921.1 hypothetical protein [Deinococcus soli (ex Cha et al. 2016)]MDR6751591.1 hypothetical protein [Deinococcus soli (ex Cha et al. 2016)]